MRWSALAAASLALGCFGQETTTPTLSTSESVVLSHSPSHHGVSASVDLANAPAYTQLDAAAADGTPGSLRLSIDAGGLIPRRPDAFIQSVAVFGYAWVDGATGRGIVAVIHPAIGRDSHQNPAGWHTHPVQLAAGTSTSSFCLAGIGGSQGGLSIIRDRMNVNIAMRQARLAAADLDVAASFIVAPDTGCAELAPGVRLGVQVIDSEVL